MTVEQFISTHRRDYSDGRVLVGWWYVAFPNAKNPKFREPCMNSEVAKEKFYDKDVVEIEESECTRMRGRFVNGKLELSKGRRQILYTLMINTKQDAKKD